MSVATAHHDVPVSHRADSGSVALVRVVAGAVGAVFVLVGVLGFVPGITQQYDALSFAGHESGAELLGLFQVSVLHNAVHLLFGVAGLALARRGVKEATGFLAFGGLIYIALALFGTVVSQMSSANFVPVNDADNVLHLGLGAVMILAGAIAPAISQRRQG